LAFTAILAALATGIVSFCLFYTPCATACTAFLLENNEGRLFGHNYDWHMDGGLIVINKRGVQKTAIVSKEEKYEPLRWVSQYASITLNQYAVESSWWSPERPCRSKCLPIADTERA
jgi:penicillin V acylase-like amidase (Ntn superfamily)